jgi:hypothetical protein
VSIVIDVIDKSQDKKKPRRSHCCRRGSASSGVIVTGEQCINPPFLLRPLCQCQVLLKVPKRKIFTVQSLTPKFSWMGLDFYFSSFCSYKLASFSAEILNYPSHTKIYEELVQEINFCYLCDHLNRPTIIRTFLLFTIFAKNIITSETLQRTPSAPLAMEALSIREKIPPLIY